MFGTFQQSNLRIELAATAIAVRHSLMKPAQLQQWLFPQTLSSGLPEMLTVGAQFTTSLGAIAVHHTVEQVSEQHLRLMLHQGIDGLHEWYWGDGWVQSRLEGISLLPLALGHSFTLLRLRQFLVGAHPQAD
jgi:hypothetical protein